MTRTAAPKQTRRIVTDPTDDQLKNWLQGRPFWEALNHTNGTEQEKLRHLRHVYNLLVEAEILTGERVSRTYKEARRIVHGHRVNVAFSRAAKEALGRLMMSQSKKAKLRVL
jgi:hypothetical protein